MKKNSKTRIWVQRYSAFDIAALRHIDKHGRSRTNPDGFTAYEQLLLRLLWKLARTNGTAKAGNTWLGALAHKITRALFFDAPAKPSSATAATVSFSTSSHRSGPKVTQSGLRMQVSCPACGQELRVPVLAKPIRVTCNNCNLVFRKAPENLATPIP